MKPLVSIIMPVYNVEKYISQSINSVLNQTYKNFELLIIIDGSPDNSGEIASMYANQDDRIEVLYKENGGLSDARNYGIEHATGEYIYFIDSDDFIEENLIEETVTAAEKNKLDVVIFGFFADFEDKNQRVVSIKSVKPQNGIYSRSTIKNYNLNDDFFNYIGYAWNKLYKLSKIKKNNLRFVKGLSLIEDIEFNYNFFCFTNKLGFLDKCLYHYIQRPRVTLGKSNYSDYYELVLKSATLNINLLSKWGFNKEIITEKSFLLYFRALGYALRSVSVNKELSIKQICKEIKRILHINENLNYHRKPLYSLSLKNKILMMLVKIKSTFGIIALFRFKYFLESKY